MLVGFTMIDGGCAVSDRQVISQAADTQKALEPAIIEDPQLANYLQAVGERIIETAKDLHEQKVGPASHFKEDASWMFDTKRMKFHFVNSKTLNAFTTGGEHMYIYTQLFEECKSEDELAAVMAHEYAHVYSRHVAKGMQNQMTTLVAGALIGAGAGYAVGGDNKTQAAVAGAGLGAAGGQFINMGFTRKDEAEADRYGFDFYTRAGWDPNHFADFFQQMINKGYDKTPAITSDHPTLKSRVEDAKRRTKELPPQAKQWRQPPVANDSKFRALQQRADELGRKLPDDQMLASSQKLLQALPRSCVAPIDPPDAVKAREDLSKQAQQGQKSKKKKKR